MVAFRRAVYTLAMGRLTRAEIDAFLAERHTIVVATLYADGRAHLTTAWYRWDGQAFWIATNRTTVKYRNLRRDPRVSLLVDAPPMETSVAAYGTVEELARDEAAWDGALAIVRRYVEDAEAYLAERRDEPRVLLRVKPERMVSWTPE
jgi:PPOX class probable F420-dependent enzyme